MSLAQFVRVLRTLGPVLLFGAMVAIITNPVGGAAGSVGRDSPVGQESHPQPDPNDAELRIAVWYADGTPLDDVDVCIELYSAVNGEIGFFFGGADVPVGPTASYSLTTAFPIAIRTSGCAIPDPGLEVVTWNRNLPGDATVQDIVDDAIVLTPGLNEVNVVVAQQRKYQPQVLCNGVTASIVGTAGDDVLIGTNQRDVIHGLGGNDVIRGLDGDDVICGGAGDDIISGHRGNDRIDGGAGADEIGAGSGDDVVFGRGGNDLIRGYGGEDEIHGGGGDDVLIGGRANDHIRGNAGNDVIAGEDGNDHLLGHSGDDQLLGGNGADRIGGGSGTFDSLIGEAGFDKCHDRDSGTGFDCEVISTR